MKAPSTSPPPPSHPHQFPFTLSTYFFFILSLKQNQRILCKTLHIPYCLCSNELQTIIRTACRKHRTRTATCSHTLPKRIIWPLYHDNNNSCIRLAAALALMTLTIRALAVVVGCPHGKAHERRHLPAICRPCSRSHHSPA